MYKGLLAVLLLKSSFEVPSLFFNISIHQVASHLITPRTLIILFKFVTLAALTALPERLIIEWNICPVCRHLLLSGIGRWPWCLQDHAIHESHWAWLFNRG